MIEDLGNTGKMLLEALELRGNAVQFPILIYGTNIRHASLLMDSMEVLASEVGCQTRRLNRNKMEVEGGCIYEFRSFAEEDSPLGGEYSHIFVDRYAEWGC